MTSTIIILSLFGLGALITVLRVEYLHKSRIITVKAEFKEWEIKLIKLFRSWGNFTQEQYDKYEKGQELIREFKFQLNDHDLTGRIQILNEIKEEFQLEFKSEFREKRLKELLKK